MKKIILSVAVLAMAFVACKKDEETTPVATTTSGSTTSGSTTSGTTTSGTTTSGTTTSGTTTTSGSTTGTTTSGTTNNLAIGTIQIGTTVSSMSVTCLESAGNTTITGYGTGGSISILIAGTLTNKSFTLVPNSQKTGEAAIMINDGTVVRHSHSGGSLVVTKETDGSHTLTLTGVEFSDGAFSAGTNKTTVSMKLTCAAKLGVTAFSGTGSLSVDNTPITINSVICSEANNFQSIQISNGEGSAFNIKSLTFTTSAGATGSIGISPTAFSSTMASLSLFVNLKGYTAQSGNLTVSKTSSSITASFSNVTFKSLTGETVTVTGSVTCQ